MPEPFPSPAHAGLGLALGLGLGLLYLVLRGTAWRPGGGDPVRAVRVHAMITALIALFASSTSGYHRLARLDETTTFPDGLTGQTTALPGGGERIVLSGQAEPLGGFDTLAALSGPVLGLALVYIVAQYTWPRQTGPVRTACLADRRATRYLPRVLGTVAIGVFLLSVAAVVLAWSTPAVEMMEVVEAYEDDYGSSSDQWTDAGNRAGSEFAPWLLAALAMIALGSLVVLRVVARRPPLGGLHPQDDHLVRQITVNRVLRTAVLMLSGVGSAAVQGWAQAHHTLASREETRVPDPVGVLEPVAGITAAALVLVMLLWRSPALRQLGDHTVAGRLPASERVLGRPGTVEAVRRLRRESITVAWTFGIIAAVATAGPMLSSAVHAHPVWAGLPFAVVLGVFGLYEVAIRRGHCPSPRVSPPFSGTTPRWAWWALGVSLLLAGAWCVLSMTTVVPQTGLATSLAVTTGVLAAGAVGGSRLALRRPPLGQATDADDEAIRSAGAERLLAVGAAGITAVTAMACSLDDLFWPVVILSTLTAMFLVGPAAPAAEPHELPVHR